MVHALVGEAGDLHVEQCEVDVLAHARQVARLQSGQDGGARIEAGEDVGERHADLDRARAFFAVGASGDAHETAHALHQEVVARALRIRPRVAEAGDGAIDEARVDRVRRGIVEPVLREAADLEVLDDHVAALRHLAHQRLAGGGREIDRDRFLVAVGTQVVGRVARVRALAVLQEWRTPQARVVAAARPLDLDDFCAQITQRLAGPGAGQDARDVEHPDVRQRAGSCLALHRCALIAVRRSP
jgi:hypothetical protein